MGVVSLQPEADDKSSTKNVNLRDVKATGGVLKAGPGKLCSIEVENNQGVDAWIQIFDQATVGVVTLGTDEPIRQFLVKANSNRQFAWPWPHLPFKKGIVVFSTTTEKGATGTAATGQVIYATVI